MIGREKLLYETTTMFGHYQVIDMVYEGRKARVLFSGNRQAAFSGIPLDENSDLLFDYIQRLFELVATIRPQRLLMIGGGTYTLPTALTHALPDIFIDVVEIDADLSTIAEAFFGYQSSERITVHHTDGKSYLENNITRYDMIIIDAFSGLKIPQSLADEATAQLLKTNLTTTGIVAMNVISAWEGSNMAPIQYFMKTYGTQFELSTVYPADNSQTSTSPQNLILILENNTSARHHGLRFAPVRSGKTSER